MSVSRSTTNIDVVAMVGTTECEEVVTRFELFACCSET